MQFKLFIPELAISLYMLWTLSLLIVSPRQKISSGILFISAFFLMIAAITTWMFGRVDVKYIPLNDYIVDALSQNTKLFILAGSAIILLAMRNCLTRYVLNVEFLTIFAIFALGQIVAVSASSTLILYLSIELMALSTCGLIAITHTLPNAKEAALKYMIMSALASSILLYGISLWYGVYGGFDYQVLREAMQKEHLLAILGTLFILIGFAFKLGLVPFHTWLPDVYQGASCPAAAMIATTPKLVTFVMFYRILYQAQAYIPFQLLAFVKIFALLSMLLGTVIGVMQKNIRRLLAYSTVANIGMMVLALSIFNDKAAGVALYYIVVYVITSLLVFTVLLEHPEIEEIHQLKGLFKKHAKSAILLALALLSMMGMPPFLGFYAKFSLIEHLLQHNTWFFVISIILTSLFSAFYYLNLIRCMFFDEPEQDQDQEKKIPIIAQTSHKYSLQAADIMAVLLIFSSVFPNYFLRVMQGFLG